MSYSVDEAIEEGEARHLFLMALKEAYPNATLQDQRWCSPDLSIEDCDGASVGGEGTDVYVELYRTIGSGRVYRGWGARVHLTLFFLDLQKDPELYKKLLEALKQKAV